MKKLEDILNDLTEEEKEKFKDLIEETKQRQLQIEKTRKKSEDLLDENSEILENLAKSMETLKTSTERLKTIKRKLFGVLDKVEDKKKYVN